MCAFQNVASCRRVAWSRCACSEASLQLPDTYNIQNNGLVKDRLWRVRHHTTCFHHACSQAGTPKPISSRQKHIHRQPSCNLAVQVHWSCRGRCQSQAHGSNSAYSNHRNIGRKAVSPRHGQLQSNSDQLQFLSRRCLCTSTALCGRFHACVYLPPQDWCLTATYACAAVN